MSLDFAGYSVSALIKGKEISHGFSSPSSGPECSVHAAAIDALAQPAMQKFLAEAVTDMNVSVDITFVINVDTCMPRM